MNSETIDLTETLGQATAGKDPHDSVDGFWEFSKEIVSCLVRSSSLRDFAVGMRLAGMDNVGKLDGVMNEKWCNDVTNYITSIIGKETLGPDMRYHNCLALSYPGQSYPPRCRIA